MCLCGPGVFVLVGVCAPEIKYECVCVCVWYLGLSSLLGIGWRFFSGVHDGRLSVGYRGCFGGITWGGLKEHTQHLICWVSNECLHF